MQLRILGHREGCELLKVTQLGSSSLGFDPIPVWFQSSSSQLLHYQHPSTAGLNMLSTVTPFRGGSQGTCRPEPPSPGRPLTQHHQLIVQPILSHLIGGLARVPPGIFRTYQGDLQDPASCGDRGTVA